MFGSIGLVHRSAEVVHRSIVFIKKIFISIPSASVTEVPSQDGEARTATPTSREKKNEHR